MNKCLYLRQRTKKGIKYLYCTKQRLKVCLNECRECIHKEYKKIKPIKKVSNKKIVVSKETYDKVFERDKGQCRICGLKDGEFIKEKETYVKLEYHHIYFRSERKDLIDDPNNGIMLCGEFANNCHKGKAHKNKKYWQPILLEKLEER